MHHRRVRRRSSRPGRDPLPLGAAGSGGGRGQSATEFALFLPAFLAIVLIGLDFGRVFLGWVSLNNSARIAANFAAQNPSAWSSRKPNTAALAQYQQLVRNDAGAINCTLPSVIPAPAFPAGTEIGAPANVTITCSFQLLTPIIGDIIGNPLSVTASAAFPIGAGEIRGIPVVPPEPTPAPSPTPSIDPDASPTPIPSPTPAPMCIVPDLFGVSTRIAQDLWGTAGHGGSDGAQFTTSVIFNPQVGGPGSDYTIRGQSLAPGQSVGCGTTYITVTP